MALFEDKRKPVDIYAKDSAATIGREKINQAIGSAARAAFINKDHAIAANGPTPKVGALPTESNLSKENPIMKWATSTPSTEAEKMVANRKSQNLKSFAPGSVTPSTQNDTLKAMREEVVGRAADREANALLYGESGRVVGGNMSQPAEKVVAPAAFTPQAMQRDGIQSTRIDSDTQRSFKRAMQPTAGDAMAYDSASPGAVDQSTRTVFTNRGQEIIRQQQPIRPTVGNEAVNPTARRMLSMNQRAGNLDIQFDKGTDQDSIKRLMENPVRPTAQIDRFNANRGQGAEQGVRAAENASRIIGPNNNRPKQVIGWQERMKYNEQAMQNAQSAENAAIDARTRLGIAKIGDATNRQQNEISRANAIDQNTVAREGNEINRLNAETNRESVTGQNSERKANVEAKNLEVGQAKKLLDLQDEYREEKDLAKKKTLENELYALQGKNQQNYQIVSKKGVAADGYTQTETPYLVDREGNTKEIGQGSGMDFSNPTAETKAYLQNLYKTNPKDYQRIKAEWLAKQAG